ncbi:MAG: hypothetical protein Q9170_007387 [Blastenia crenularia]
MILQGNLALARLSHFSSQCLDKRAIVPLAFNIIRVPSVRQLCSVSHESHGSVRSTLTTPLSHRLYATAAVSRPKAHTGRTTSAPRKKASTAKAPTASSAGAAKKPAAKKAGTKKPAAEKTKSKAKAKSKPRTRAKSTKARKKPVKAKKRALTPEQKEKLVEQKKKLAIKNLKAKALTVPKKLPFTAFSVLLAEKTKGGVNVTTVATDVSATYKSFKPEEREHYNHIANQNKATNTAAYQAWIRSFTPVQIHEANNARQLLKKRRTKGQWPKLEDERLVKGPKSSYTFFHIQRYRSGDFAGMSVGQAAKLIGTEWRALSAEEKKTYVQQSEEDSARYDQEVKAVYNRGLNRTTASRRAAKAA